MKIAIVNAQDWTERRGGGELSIKYWYNKGIEQGLDITMVTNNKPDINHDYDYYIIANYPEMDMDYILWVTQNKPHVFLVTSSIYWGHLDTYTRNAKGFIFMAPDHALQHGKQDKKHFFTPPYIDHTIFRDTKDDEKYAPSYAYFGLIHPIKVNQKMFSFMRDNPNIDFFFYGNNEYEDMPSYENIIVQDPLRDDDGVAKFMNKHGTLFWYLDRYGCYGRTIVEALLCEMDLEVNREAFGLFKYDWIDKGRNSIVDTLEKELDTFWSRTLALFDN